MAADTPVSAREAGAAPGQAATVPGVYIRWCHLDGFNPPPEDIAAMYAGKTNAERYFWESLDECAQIAGAVTAAAAAQPEVADVADVVLDGIVRDILESLCRRDGLSLESSVVPGEPARNYDLADRLGIGHVFGLKPPDAASAQPAPGDEVAMLRADIADYEKLLARWPKCPAGCNCRIGLPDDPDANECGCDGPCNGGEQPAPELAAASPELTAYAGENRKLRDIITEILSWFSDNGSGRYARVSATILARAYAKAGLPVPDELRRYL